MGMAEKLKYCGAQRFDFWPFGSFDAMCDVSKTEHDLFDRKRDINVIFIGMPHLNKMPILSKIQKALGRNLLMIGFPIKYAIYYNVKFRFPGNTRRPIRSCEQYISLYQRSKIGINVHNRGKYTVGNYRMYDLPANGVMQISDGEEYLNEFFDVGEEIISYHSVDELIDQVRYYLDHDEERERIALNGFRRVRNDYKIDKMLKKAGDLIKSGMEKKDFK
jgi:spore maturation protein CgeB